MFHLFEYKYICTLTAALNMTPSSLHQHGLEVRDLVWLSNLFP